ncbi:related to alkaline phosphatase Pho8 [Ramularia collo-cygni]|uniref:Alkaline phosphatase n=1 Tax=Ramularia collo-cygni TaxID=112498 RepID=A0A2D3UWN4_9PEZI|nr:related to alkaline phosphatase Pho8 [Ramularia collo-cygni]CZT22232.1 related to alkaline phosphatase Pho8 [Ramularia collo-cygni]
MSSGRNAPVFQRPDSVNSGEQGIEEEDALLTGQRPGKREPINAHNKGKWREIVLFAWALVATAAVVILAVVFQHNTQVSDGGDKSKHGGGKRNLIFMVSDGMGPTSLELARSWRQYTDQLPWNNTLVLDKHLIGQSRTRSSSSLVTDSAAGATAFSCGIKSYNGAISVLPSFDPCGSVMEAAKRKGYTTGLVVTTRITDATPAVFASHVRRREMEDDIALQMIGETHPLGRMVDLMMGGGRCHFLPNTTEGGCRADDVDVIKTAGEKGWNYISTRNEFDHLGPSVELPLLALFSPTDIPYEVDRRHQNEVYPSLEEMAKTALTALSAATKDSDQGFFVMIEGSRIDHAGHANDPGAQVHEVLAYDRTIAAVLDFIKHEETPTLMVSTSDHETGGLAAARQLHEDYPQYLWYPGVLANVSHSASHVSREYQMHISSLPEDLSADAESEAKKTYIKELTARALGINDPSTEEISDLIQRPERASYIFADMVSRRAQTGWSTHGHSGADVNIYTSDSHAAKALRGNHENTEVGEFLRNYLDLGDEVEKVTRLLQRHGHENDETWMGSVPQDGERLDGQDHLDAYHGDHKTKRCAVCGI